MSSCSSCGDPIKLVFEVKTVVANYSTLPNALLGVDASVKMRDGSWQPAETRLDPKTPLPINVPSLHTVRLDLVVTLAAIGIVAGILVAFAVTRVMSNLLFGVSPTDLPTFTAVPAALAVVAALAVYVPAWRSTRIDPIIALREE